MIPLRTGILAFFLFLLTAGALSPAWCDGSFESERGNVPPASIEPDPGTEPPYDLDDLSLGQVFDNGNDTSAEGSVGETTER